MLSKRFTQIHFEIETSTPITNQNNIKFTCLQLIILSLKRIVNEVVLLTKSGEISFSSIYEEQLCF